MNDQLLEAASAIDELLEIGNLIDDKHISEALDDIVKLSVRRDVSDATARMLVVKLQAIANTCALKAKYYVHVKKPKAGTDDYLRKNFYFELSGELDKLVSALKYLCNGGR